ncbi:MAG: glycosyltransferase family 39 protein [Deltaproteobacteria bacterium]|nr:glycosyltransferase family 39 protein [Deltaproteobacteria bacterium]
MALLKHRNLLIALLAALTLARLLYIAFTPFDLSPDEAHYWEWSRRLGLSYYSKGPLAAYVIAFFTAIFGNTAFAVRAGAVFFSTGVSVVVYLFGRDVFESEKTGFYSALLVNASPLFSVGAILMTTDVLLVFFWISSVYSVKKAVDTKASLWWYLAGAAAGLGFLSKYTAALIYPSVFIYLLSSLDKRFWLKRKEPYIAIIISLILTTPVVVWNVMHGQVTIRHTMGQAAIGEGAFSIASAVEFIASQAFLITPFIFIGLVYGVCRSAAAGFKERRDGLLLIAASSAPLFLFLLVKSLHGKVQANWAAFSYASAMPAAVWAFGELYGKRGGPGKRVLRYIAAIGVLTGFVISAFAYFPWVFNAIGAKDVMWRAPFNRVIGWQELGDKVSLIKEDMEKGGRLFIMSDTYQVASELAFYVRGNPVTYNINIGTRRMNQYDLWPGFTRLAGYNAIYVKGGASEMEMKTSLAFDRCDKEAFTVNYKGVPFKEYSIFRCYNFSGTEFAPPEGRY